MGELNLYERVEADKGYRGEEDYLDTPGDCLGWSEGYTCEEAKGQFHIKRLLRARHETINRRFKSWSVLGKMFRHHWSLHQKVFKAVVTITQLQIMYGAYVWDIGAEYKTLL